MTTTADAAAAHLLRRDAAERRAAAFAGVPVDQARHTPPNDGERARSIPFGAQMRAKLVQRDGKDFYQLDGYASVTDRPYEMWDFFGPFDEEVVGGSFDATLAAKPDVAFLVNHKGITMARTTNNSLTLSVDALGLRSEAFLNPERQDVRDLISAITDGLITEMSFAFMLEDATWNDDFTKFSITQVNIDRGDVSAVNYGANPYTSIAARAREVLADIEHLPVGAARAALGRLQKRTDSLAPVRVPEPEPKLVGRSVGQLDAWLAGIPEVRIAVHPAASMPAHRSAPIVKDALRRELRRLLVQMQHRALSPEDTASLTSLLMEVSSAYAAIHPFHEVVHVADMALDDAEDALLALLGLPNSDEAMEPMDGMPAMN